MMNEEKVVKLKEINGLPFSIYLNKENNLIMLLSNETKFVYYQTPYNLDTEIIIKSPEELRNSHLEELDEEEIDFLKEQPQDILVPLNLVYLRTFGNCFEDFRINKNKVDKVKVFNMLFLYYTPERDAYYLKRLEIINGKIENEDEYLIDNSFFNIGNPSIIDNILFIYDKIVFVYNRTHVLIIEASDSKLLYKYLKIKFYPIFHSFMMNNKVIIVAVNNVTAITNLSSYDIQFETLTYLNEKNKQVDIDIDYTNKKFRIYNNDNIDEEYQVFLNSIKKIN